VDNQKHIMKYLKIIYSLVIITMMTACASTGFVQSNEPNAATFTVLNPRTVGGERYKPYILTSIGSKTVKNAERMMTNGERGTLVHQISYVTTKVSPEEHQLEIKVTAYNMHRAKHNSKIYNVEFLPNASYELFVEVPEKVSEELDGDSWARLSLKKYG